uniref:RNA-directed RNA polymerase n=1 Tax=Umbelopsis ramanniana virus 4 TaxID=2583334 RepID=A0A509ELT7_9VIRU|nr:RNA dependent RNA polymerase [Umbelopsis ramanniana virus 4]
MPMKKPKGRVTVTLSSIYDNKDGNFKNVVPRNSDPMPLTFRKSNSGGHILVPFRRAEYVLIDVIEGDYGCETISYSYYGSVVKADTICRGGMTYVYYHVDQLLSPMSRNILGILSRHFMDDFTGYYNDMCSLDNVFLGSGVASPQQRHTLHSIKNLSKAKISAEHHIHYTAEEVWSTLDSAQRSKAEHALRITNEATTTMMGGVMLWLAMLPDELHKRFVNTDILDADTMVEFARRAKKLSVTAKSYQNIVEVDLRTVFEVDVLVNRDVGKVDWEGEKQNRVKPDTVNISKKTVYDEARKLFSRTDNTRLKPRKLKWEDFWKTRWQWSASGSVHSQYAIDIQNLPKERELRNKFILLTQTPYREFDFYATRKPQIQAWSSVKYEWGKMRAIYGTDLTSYILAHYAFYNCEDTLPNEFPVGNKARPSYVSAKVGAILKGRIPLCIDFEDFNSGHRNDSMEAVLQAYIDEFHEDLDPMQLSAAEWTKQSISATIVNDNMGTKTQYKTNGTLMSGWRLTTYMNSILNYIYTKLLTKDTESTYQSVHNGDDVLLGVRNFDIARRAVFNADKYNVRLQRSKCTFGGIAEFLRVDRVRGDFGQYLSRNVATLMHARIESKLALSVVDLVEASEERLREFIQRGGSPKTAARLRSIAYDRYSKIYETDTATLYRIKYSHRVAGGISDGLGAPIDQVINKDQVGRIAELPDYLPGIADYSNVLKKSLNLNMEVSKIAKRIYSATLNAVKLERTKVHTEVPENIEQLKVYRALYKAHSDATDNAAFGKAILTGFVFDVLSRNDKANTLMGILYQSKDPMQLLKVIA